MAFLAGSIARLPPASPEVGKLSAWAPPDSAADETRPIVVDLDSTLVRTNTQLESVFVLARQHPLRCLQVPLWLLRGRRYCQRRIADEAMPDVATLPYREELIRYLRDRRKAGRRVVLATAADARLADRVAQHLDLFDAVIASGDAALLSPARKLAELTRRFGAGGFDYIGARRGELPPSRERHPAARLVEAVRVPHWTKNVLVALPLLDAHIGLDPSSLERALAAFVAFSLCASSVYLLNDLLDLPNDRRHPANKGRQIAAGGVSPGAAVALMICLVIAAATLGWHLSLRFLGALFAYWALMCAYSVRLKSVAPLDIAILGTGYGLRVWGGAAAMGLRASPWLLAFTVLLFVSMALIKRYAQLTQGESLGQSLNGQMRDYASPDRAVLLAQGVGSGYVSVLALAVDTGQARGAWALCALLYYWITYLWLQAARGKVGADPVMFVLRDRSSIGLLLGMVLAAFWVV